VILGSTYTGHYEQVEAVSQILDKYQAETGIDVPIHVDGASGAMFCPFATPSVKFGFEIPRVMSINTYPQPDSSPRFTKKMLIASSGNKYGLVYAGLGWIIFRNEETLPKFLKFELHYLGGMSAFYAGANGDRNGGDVYVEFFEAGGAGHCSVL
jgi:glutamate decarboxylase